MQKFVLTSAVVVSILAGFSSSALAQSTPTVQRKSCDAVFVQNKLTIETMAQAGNTSGIQALFTRAGCGAPAVNVGKLPASTKKELARMKCTFKLIPPTIECTFGMASSAGQQNSY